MKKYLKKLITKWKLRKYKPEFIIGADGNEVPFVDCSDISEYQKMALVQDFTKLTAKNAFALFMTLGFKTHMEVTIIDSFSGDTFQFYFKKVLPKENT